MRFPFYFNLNKIHYKNFKKIPTPNKNVIMNETQIHIKFVKKNYYVNIRELSQVSILRKLSRLKSKYTHAEIIMK